VEAAVAAADMAGASGREPLLRSEIHGFITYAGSQSPLRAPQLLFFFSPFLCFSFAAADSVAFLGFVVRSLLFEA
jgi:hypothetical protein